ncbi:MAG: type III secretion inner membrane ring lipoprotein SctJ [Paracoccus sp. (in: a-proteobacteria)]|uniref:type III secretion system inner membrane ring lipoprotein SctJ n=1 Tax=Paracoccus sp. TaxID=267 RepID=UPI0026DF3D62|nr:type III secretion inner membrane ring lipoprotein SctJ [Paracoccus sp. (in: a-proteobacteria)]MDO5621574.1 type III secretion inner membrane ring lipoprotein SctJ [Paracoccus sp. (in: a-proteobacteria)]
MTLTHTRRLAAMLCLTLALTACKANLYTGLTEHEANEMVAALIGAGIPASKSGSANSISVSVDEARFADAMAVLNARGLPARQYASMGDVFKKEGLVSSPTEERARLIYALSQELSRTIAEIDGVLSARIHVVLPQSDMLGRDVKPSSASVFVRYAAGSDVENYSAQIKLLVANSIEGLLYDNITVVMVPATETAPTQSNAPALSEVLGVWVHPASASRLWAMFGGLAALALAGFGLAGWPMLRARLAQRRDTGFDSPGEGQP